MAEYHSKPTIRMLIFNKYKGHCAYCGCKLNPKHFSVDHIEPKFRNYSNLELSKMSLIRGEDKLENLNPCCSGCNSSKSSFSLEKWREEINTKFTRLMKYEPSFNLLVRLNILPTKGKKWLFYFEKL
jgi:5-methylcytosine-specific restriction endonuclease McrA